MDEVDYYRQQREESRGKVDTSQMGAFQYALFLLTEKLRRSDSPELQRQIRRSRLLVKEQVRKELRQWHNSNKDDLEAKVLGVFKSAYPHTRKEWRKDVKQQSSLRQIVGPVKLGTTYLAAHQTLGSVTIYHDSAYYKLYMKYRMNMHSDGSPESDEAPEQREAEIKAYNHMLTITTDYETFLRDLAISTVRMPAKIITSDFMLQLFQKRFIHAVNLNDYLKYFWRGVRLLPNIDQPNTETEMAAKAIVEIYLPKLSLI